MDWSKKYKNKCIIKKRYKYIYSVPLAKSVDYILSNVFQKNSIKKILEVGAGENSYKNFFQTKRADITYKTFDIDKSTKQDYYDIDDIKETFDLIIGLEVIEHMDVNNIESLCSKLLNLTSSKGLLVLSTPNIYHSNRFLTDLTHRTPLSYDELGSLLVTLGYKGIIQFRVYSDSTIRRILRQYTFFWLYRLLEINYAKGIAIVASK